LNHRYVLLILLLMIAVSAALRAYVAFRGKARSAQLMPPATQLSWRASVVRRHQLRSRTETLIASGASTTLYGDPLLDSDRLEREETLWSPLTAGAFADGFLAGMPIVQAVSHIDPSVLKALESSTAEHIHAFPSVHSYVEQHFFAAPTMTADGWFERLTGYVTEQKAASALEAAGHHVVFAATANQPVWDLLVDGHPVQIKEGLSGVRPFLAAHHGIPVYTSHEVAAAIKDPMVHGLAGLSSSQIHQSAHDSIEGISDAFDPGFHFPLITLAFAGYREAKLLFQERTTVGRAVKHVGLDVAGVGAGAFGGAKAGAFAGAFLGPIGAAIGGLFGAIAGGIGGKMLSTGIRHVPFQQAKTKYEETADSAQQSISIAIDRTRDDVRKLQNTYQLQYLEARARISESTSFRIAELAEAYDRRFGDFIRGFAGYLDELTISLEEQERMVLETVPGGGVRGLFLPSTNDHLRGAIRAWFRRARKTLRQERSVFSKLEPQTVESLGNEVRRFLATYAFELETLESELVHLASMFQREKDFAARLAAQAEVDLQRERDGLIGEFSTRVQGIHASLLTAVDSWNRRVTAVRDDFRREARAIGIDI
jgi:hypothetical protein